MFSKPLLAATLLTGILASTGAMAIEVKNLDSLPKKGTVSLEGVVDSVDDKRTLTLRDDMGNTIDVKSVADLNVQEGDRVEISGTVESDFAGIGREIASATVTKVASAGAAGSRSPSGQGSQDSQSGMDTPDATGSAPSDSRY